MTAPTPLIAGNWKMNGTLASLDEARAVAAGLDGVKARVAICPPAWLIHPMSQALGGSSVLIGAQDCYCEASGAFTGDLSAEMLAEAGAKLVILGHSERRAGYGETDALVAAKVGAVLRAGLEPIVCVGETLEQRKAGAGLGDRDGPDPDRGRDRGDARRYPRDLARPARRRQRPGSDPLRGLGEAFERRGDPARGRGWRGPGRRRRRRPASWV